MQYVSTVTRIRNRLTTVVDGLAQLIRGLPIRDRDNGDLVRVMAPKYEWGELSATQRATLIALKRSYEPISELLRLLLSRGPQTIVQQIEDADKQLRIWLELSWNYNLSADPATNENALRLDLAALEQILAVLEVTGASDLILVPDTNTLLAMPDPTHYRGVARQDSFTFMLLPTILGELDRLKVDHRNPDVREKAKKAITRIKGWRQQGSMNKGVTVDKSITVKTCHSEPDMKRTLSWLDADVPDDRIVASVLELQAEQPSARITLVSGDINLQNKADAALIQTAEIS